MMLDTVLQNVALRSLLCSESEINRAALLYEDIKKFETCVMPISHAHIIYQKYLSRDAPLFVPVSKVTANKIHKILWKDEDGADSEGLVKSNFFEEIKNYTLRVLNEALQRQQREPIFRDAMARESKTRRKKEKQTSFEKFTLILKAKRKPAELGDPKTWSTEKVCQWLDDSSLSLYVKLFEENSITGADLLELTASDLASIGVASENAQHILTEVARLADRRRRNTL